MSGRSNEQQQQDDGSGMVPRAIEPESFAFSGKIMLSAVIILFVVVVLIICLHVYARWYLTRTRRRQRLRRRHRRSAQLVFTLDLSQSASVGLDAAIWKALPTFVCTGEDNWPECAVCLSEFDQGETGRLLPKCNHSFHSECIDMWFKSHSTCPLCRSPVEIPTNAPLLQIVTEPGPSQVAAQVGESCSSSNSSNEQGHENQSVGSRRKGLGVSIEIPRRNESFKNMEEEGSISSSSPFKSPGGRIMSFKRMLSRDRRPSTPTPPSYQPGTDSTGIDLERGEVAASGSIS